jgi:hypothetical protein
MVTSIGTGGIGVVITTGTVIVGTEIIPSGIGVAESGGLMRRDPEVNQARQGLMRRGLVANQAKQGVMRRGPEVNQVT